MWEREEHVTTLWLTPRRLLVLAAVARGGQAYLRLRVGRPDGRGGVLPGRQELVVPVSEATRLRSELRRAEALARRFVDAPWPAPRPSDSTTQANADQCPPAAASDRERRSRSAPLVDREPGG